jgi:3-oxoacyl-[acyl-carrier-protein] synthase-1
MKNLAVIAGCGARTSLGLTARHTSFLYRAGLAGMTEAPILDPAEEPITMCTQPTLDPFLVGAGRALRMAAPALDEALAEIGEPARGMRTKLILCVDEHLGKKREVDGVIPASVVANMLQRRAQELITDIVLEISPRGPASPGFALPDDLDALARGTLDMIVIGGVHSDYDPQVITQLAEAGRLYTPEHLDAMIPGEAAAFCALLRHDVARRHGLEPYAVVNAIGTAFDKARPDNDESAFEAVGMMVALRKAAADMVASKGRAGWMLNDMTFEMFRMHELQSVLVRTQEIWCPPQQMDFPCQRMGYLGAAAMPVEMILAGSGFRHRWAPHAVAMAVAGSDSGERAAMLLSAVS